jgi:hypothetical protein
MSVQEKNRRSSTGSLGADRVVKGRKSSTGSPESTRKKDRRASATASSNNGKSRRSSTGSSVTHREKTRRFSTGSPIITADNVFINAQKDAQNAQLDRMKMEYDMVAEENRILEQRLRDVYSVNSHAATSSVAMKRTNVGRSRTIKRIADRTSEQLLGNRNIEHRTAVRELQSQARKLRFRSPRYRPGHTNYVPSHPAGVPMTGPRANPGGVVYSNWSRTKRFPGPKPTPGPSDYNPNYDSPMEQYVYVPQVKPYGKKKNPNFHNTRQEDTAAVVTLFARSLAIADTSPIKKLLSGANRSYNAPGAISATKHALRDHSPTLMLQQSGEEMGEMQNDDSQMQELAIHKMKKIQDYLEAVNTEEVNNFRQYKVMFDQLKELSTKVFEKEMNDLYYLPDGDTEFISPIKKSRVGVSNSKKVKEVCGLVERFYASLLGNVSQVEHKDGHKQQYRHLSTSKNLLTDTPNSESVTMIDLPNPSSTRIWEPLSN